ncbi:MAG: hypothetical protein J5605_03505, partial [Bacteroidales bacterium]|nr:hypothetical protein [Bacteroidales bacterium]
MKRFIITTIFTLTAFASIWAKPAKLDTLYYDKDWKPTSSATFASYYRVYEISTNTTSAKPFRDYYITGEIYADGKFISIDKENDDLSVFTDEMVIYYKSGKTAKKMSYKNGKLEGNYTEYFDNGLIALNTSYKNGIEDGTRTEFSENGESFTQVEITNGEFKYDYYYASNKAGQFSKLSIANNTPVWEKPDISECQFEYKDGNKWLYYTNNGICIK